MRSNSVVQHLAHYHICCQHMRQFKNPAATAKWPTLQWTKVWHRTLYTLGAMPAIGMPQPVGCERSGVPSEYGPARESCDIMIAHLATPEPPGGMEDFLPSPLFTSSLHTERSACIPECPASRPYILGADAQRRLSSVRSSASHSRGSYGSRIHAT